MVQEKYTVITGASSGIGYEAAKAFAERGKNLVIIARRGNNLERLKREILEKSPDLDIVIRSTDLSIPENVYQLYEGLKEYEIETWINNAGFGNYDSVAHQDLKKIGAMLHLNIEALTILSSLYVRDYKDTELEETGAKMKVKVLAPAATRTEFGMVANDVSEYD